MVLLKNIGIVAAIVAGQTLLTVAIWLIFKKIQKRIKENASERIKPISIKKLRVLSVRQIIQILSVLVHLIKYLITIFQFFITLPIIFSRFPQTENLASSLFNLIFTPLKKIGASFVGYIPNLFTIAIILIIMKYVLRTMKFFADKIDKEKLKIKGFYHEWAKPTFNILRFLLYAFTIAIIFPYLPGSGSHIFQGVSVFVGIIISLGSSTAIGNLIAGLVITYMRPFKVGDRIQINGLTGFVAQKDIMVIRIRTHKNEYITLPNMQVLSSSIINYNTSCDENEEGLVLYAEVTYNYATPWRLIRNILIDAAGKTPNVLKNPKPFVLQTGLDNNFVKYQINCYTKEIAKIPSTYARLYENIQDGFYNNGLDMTTPDFKIILPPESRDPPPELAKGFLPEVVKAVKKRSGYKRTKGED